MEKPTCSSENGWACRETGLFERNILQMPLQSITMGYKQEKSRPVMEMESTDQSVRDANVQIHTGGK